MADDEQQLIPRLAINGSWEPRYWREVETGPRSGEWVSSGQPGPPLSVVVTPKGLEVYGSGLRLERALRPSEARWLACRLLEALGMYEATFAGDGSAPPGGGSRPPLAVAGGTDVAIPMNGRVWRCECGKESANRGALAIHEKTCGKVIAEVEG